MPRKDSEAVPEGNGPVPQQEEFGSGQPTLVDVYQKIEDVWDKNMDEITRLLEQHLTRLEHDARQPRLVVLVDGLANSKTCERMEGAATAVQAMHGDSFSASRVDPGSKTNSSSFGVKAEPLALPCRDDVLVENGAAAPKSCLPSLEMRSPTAADSLLPTGEASIATRTTFNQPPLRLSSTVETNSKKTSTPHVLYDSSFFQKNNLPAVACQRVIETKSGENRMFDPGGSRSSSRLPVFGIVACVALRRGSC